MVFSWKLNSHRQYVIGSGDVLQANIYILNFWEKKMLSRKTSYNNTKRSLGEGSSTGVTFSLHSFYIKNTKI